jgi:hypothetical protein
VSLSDPESATTADGLARERPDLFDVHVMLFGGEARQAVVALSRLFALEPELAEQIVASAPVTVKHRVTQDQAERFVQALGSIGAEAVLLPSADDGGAPSASHQQAAVPAGSAPAWGGLDIESAATEESRPPASGSLAGIALDVDVPFADEGGAPAPRLRRSRDTASTMLEELVAAAGDDGDDDVPTAELLLGNDPPSAEVMGSKAGEGPAVGEEGGSGLELDVAPAKPHPPTSGPMQAGAAPHAPEGQDRTAPSRTGASSDAPAARPLFRLGSAAVRMPGEGRARPARRRSRADSAGVEIEAPAPVRPREKKGGDAPALDALPLPSPEDLGLGDVPPLPLRTDLDSPSGDEGGLPGAPPLPPSPGLADPPLPPSPGLADPPPPPPSPGAEGELPPVPTKPGFSYREMNDRSQAMPSLGLASEQSGPPKAKSPTGGGYWSSRRDASVRPPAPAEAEVDEEPEDSRPPRRIDEGIDVPDVDDRISRMTRAGGMLLSAVAVFGLGIYLDRSILHGTANPLWIGLHAFAIYALGVGVAGLRP